MSRHVNGPWPVGSEASVSLVDVVRGDEREPPVGAERRVWAAIEARRKRRFSLSWTLGVAVMATACALAIGLSHRARTASTETPAQVVARHSGDGKLSVFDLHGAAEIVATEGSELRLVEDAAAGVTIELDRGSLLAHVAPRPVTAPFLVVTPHAKVRVVGTVLWVDVDGDGATTVAVGHGAVEVTASGLAPVVVRAGERWPASSARSPSRSEVGELRGADGELHWAGDPSQTDSQTPRAPKVQSSPPPSHPSGAAACRNLANTAALKCLDGVAASDDPLRAESALFEIGWRRLRDANDVRGALSAWERQRARFPSGVLRADADVSIIEALGRIGDDARAAREIDAWLAGHPDALATPEIHYLRGAVDHRAGDCAAALRELDLALRSPSDPWAADARAERAICASQEKKKNK